MRRLKTSQTENNYYEDIENPETGFEKLMNLTPDTKVKECKNLIQSMRENMLFEKQIIEKTSDVQIPKEVRSEKKHKQTFKNYEKVIKFSNLEKSKNHFYHRNVKSNAERTFNKMKNLSDIVENRKNQMLIDESLLKIEKNQVKIILQNEKEKEDVFEEALFLERFYDLEKDQKNGEELTLKIPEKFRGIHPKHMRISEVTKKEEDFYRRKHVYNQRKFQFYKSAMKMEKNSLITKKNQNVDVLRTLLAFNRAKLEDFDPNDGNDIKLKRLFLVYSSSETDNPENVYKIITKESIKKFFKDFQIDWENNTQLQEYLDSIKIIHEFQFLEILYILANIGDSFFSNIENYLKTKIWVNFHKMIPKPWKNLEKYRKALEKLIKLTKYRAKVEGIFDKKIEGKTGELRNLLTFNQYLQIMWETKFYPLKVDKKVLRFTYLYEKSFEYGINVENLTNLFIILGVYCGPTKTQLSNMKWAIEFVTGFKND